jgi:hypothetical protein
MRMYTQDALQHTFASAAFSHVVADSASIVQHMPFRSVGASLASLSKVLVQALLGKQPTV